MLHVHSALCLPNYIYVLQSMSFLTATYCRELSSLRVTVTNRAAFIRVAELPPSDLPVYVLELLTLLLEHDEIVYSARGSYGLPVVTGVL